MDGVIDSRTACACLLRDYPDQPGHRGQPLFADFDRIATEIDRRGLQIAVHAIGDGAVRVVIDGYQAASSAGGVAPDAIGDSAFHRRSRVRAAFALISIPEDCGFHSWPGSRLCSCSRGTISSDVASRTESNARRIARRQLPTRALRGHARPRHHARRSFARCHQELP
ncbi:hypothetical protein DPM13_00585 [Paracoccus mutanolyticus]|uniref:Amidohydrolase 3 domain-containing protein n=1 Tax=Paracoccus mutanolyticus TaxID=1499308 RepID=A0ABM6WUL5_9RHOB|nr:amidohydrolase family protein [Paracoccus mutanolyticus]AWX94335.1 hypothetical protein DPM13_00585 [Paracoccus mutanolyticus]